MTDQVEPLEGEVIPAPYKPMRDEKGRLLPGYTGNPNGRPKGSRHKLQEDFVHALAVDFEANGVDAIKRVRQEDPATYIKVIAAIIPKELTVDVSGNLVSLLSKLGTDGREQGAGNAPALEEAGPDSVCH